MPVPDNKTELDGAEMIPQILRLSEEIFRAIKLSIPPEWLMTDMTVAQLRVLLLLHTDGETRMSSIAGTLGIAVSTATGIIDNLVKKDLVIRSAAAEDRRVVICALSPKGHETIDRIWAQGRMQIEKLLHGLTEDRAQTIVSPKTVNE
jgi:DNA-binding MarR family transcriptional regulator